MRKHARFFIVFGIVFVFVSLTELVLCFHGPFVLDVKTTVFVFPFYSAKEDAETRAIRERFSELLSGSKRHIVIGIANAEKTLAENGTSLSAVMKTPNAQGYAKAAGVIGVDKFVMGYILKTAAGYEVLANVYLAKQAESALVVKETGDRFDALYARLPAMIEAIDGGKTDYSLVEILYFLAILFHALFGIALVLGSVKPAEAQKIGAPIRLNGFLYGKVPEILFVFTFILFAFSYIYALNANMDYVQKFMATGGNLHLAQNTDQERLNSFARFLPFLLLTVFFYIRIRLPDEGTKSSPPFPRDFRNLWPLPLTVLSAFLSSCALPSFLDIDGWPLLGYVSLVPLLLVFEKNSIRSCVFYGVAYGTLNTLFANFWLGTFSLVSLQFVIVLFFTGYVLFMIPAAILYKLAGELRFLVFPAGWVAFDYLQSVTFTGYPWAMLGASQYAFTPLIQTAALTGVWGVTFIVILANSGIAHLVSSLLDKKPEHRYVPVVSFAIVFVASVVCGSVYIGISERDIRSNGRTVKIAQIQDSMDSRKHSTTEVLAQLIALSNEALEEKPDLVVWPECSFNTDLFAFPESSEVRTLIDFQKSTGTWLLTGCMDYKDKELARNSDEKNIPAYNSAMLLTPDAVPAAIYHKMHLVPFTEYFPFEKELPLVAKMLRDFDINWWEKGESRVIFQHPKFSFFTPICYEDVFPGEIALFVRNGADAILNLSNDFWSLSPVEGKQHAIDALFRAVENARPLLRTTTSGLTCYIDANGRIRNTLPHYERGFYVADVSIPGKGNTFYTIAGDWFPWLLIIGLCGLFLGRVIGIIRKKSGK